MTAASTHGGAGKEEKEIRFTDSQRQAFETLKGRLFIPAGAGSGKTEVVAHRFVQAVATGAAKVDEILTITFTRKAAAEMMHRVREVLRKRMLKESDEEILARLGDAYRNVERARISTIDSFCSSILRANALAAGLDPDFKTLDADQAELLGRECFDSCLYDVASIHGDEAVELITAYDPKLTGELYDAIIGCHEELRSRGQPLGLPLPDPAAVIDEAARELSAAMDDFEAAVKREGVSNKTVDRNLEAVLRLRQAIAEKDPADSRMLAAACKVGGNAGRVNEECQVMKQASTVYLTALHAPLAWGVLRMMGIILKQFHTTYQVRKRELGVLDFADLSLMTRDLLKSNSHVRDRLAAGFELLMVDEFQDTNPLQYQIAEVLDRDNLMMVGDENQSIFGFRDAEVGLFRKEKRRAKRKDYLVPLERNFRSQPEILTFVDRMFNGPDMLAPGYLELEPGADADTHHEDFRVEVIAVDTNPPGSDSILRVDQWLKVEAQLIAERLRDIYREGWYAPGDTAILIENRSGVEVYRDALTSQGIETYLSIGVGYYDRQELGDTINLLGLLVNAQDDAMLTGVLRSPMVGVSDDALYWLSLAADRGGNGRVPLWTVMASGDKLEKLAVDDRKKLEDFIKAFQQLRERARRRPLTETARKVINFNDYVAGRVACANGKQIFANLMKLVDMAADYESSWGRSLTGFVTFLTTKKVEQPREAEPPVEEEGVAAVRFLTMHAAKGLEFPLVVVPKLAGKKGASNSKPVLLLDRDREAGRIGLVLQAPGEKKTETFDYGQLEREEAERELAEEKRLHYVAMTRARRHLILVGSAKLDDKPKATDDLKVRPFDWVRSRLGLDRASRSDLDTTEVISDIEGVDVGLSVCTDPEAVVSRAPEAGEVSKPQPLPAVDAGIMDVPQMPVYVPSVVSPTSLDVFNRCPRCYYLDRVLHLDDLLAVGIGKPAAAGCNLSATDMGTLVHSVLETDLPAVITGQVEPDFLDERLRELMAPGMEMTPEDHERALRLLGNFSGSAVAEALSEAAAEGALQSEVPFAMQVGQSVIQGKIDALVAGDEARPTLVVDYKTSSLADGETPGEAAAAYRFQMASYALAAHHLHEGPVQLVVAFLGGESAAESLKDYGVEDIPILKSEISTLLKEMSISSFLALEEYDPYYCMFCPGSHSGASICPTGASGSAQ